MIIRPATKQDIDRLSEIEREHPDYPAWGENGLNAEFLNKNSVFLLAETQNKIAGFINFWILKPEIQLNALVVASDFLREGVGTSLVDAMIKHARDAACSKINLEVSEKNQPAINFYSKLGFKMVGTRPKFYNNSDSAILMSLEIKAD